jgi:adenylate cyclase class 2
MNHEIEIKARVGDLDKVMACLTAAGCVFDESIDQEDIIFAAEDIFSASHTPNPNVLRIRKQISSGVTKTIFTFKKNRSNELDCIEHETEITDVEELTHILKYLGYQEVIRVRKIRRKGKINDLEICCDQVVDLGNFIEVEKMSDQDGVVVQDQLWQWLESLGIDSLERVTQGYDTLLYNKLHS